MFAKLQNTIRSETDTNATIKAVFILDRAYLFKAPILSAEKCTQIMNAIDNPLNERQVAQLYLVETNLGFAIIDYDLSIGNGYHLLNPALSSHDDALMGLWEWATEE